MWLVRHLEVIRMMMLEDLRIAKHHLVPCFPPKYNIFQVCTVFLIILKNLNSFPKCYEKSSLFA